MPKGCQVWQALGVPYDVPPEGIALTDPGPVPAGPQHTAQGPYGLLACNPCTGRLRALGVFRATGAFVSAGADNSPSLAMLIGVGRMVQLVSLTVAGKLLVREYGVGGLIALEPAC